MSTTSLVLFRGACAAAFVAAALAGWHFTGSTTAPAAAGATPGQTAGPENGKRARRAGRNSGVPEHVRQTMAAIRNAGSPEQRMRATIELANSLPIAELAEWLENRWFDAGEGYELSLFHKIALQRWEAEDREGMIAWNLKGDSYRAAQMLAALAKEDPARALAFLNGHPNPGLEMQTLTAIAGTDPALALAHMKEMFERPGQQTLRNFFQNDLFRTLAQKDPAALEAALGTFPQPWQSRAEAALVGERLEKSFSDELAQLATRPDGWMIFKGALGGREKMLARFMDELPNLPDSWKRKIGNEAYRFVSTNNAREWLEMDLAALGMDERQQRHLRHTAIQHYSFTNPAGALAMIDGLGLDDQSRKSIISNVISNNTPASPEKIGEIIAALGSEEDREAARALVEARQESSGSGDSKVKGPEEWLEKMSTVSENNTYMLFNMLRGWDKEKMSALADGFRGMPDDKKLPVAKALASSFHYRGVDSSLQGEAIRYLVSQPPAEEGADSNTPTRSNDDPVQVASRYAVSLSGSDPDAAVRWVQSLPAGEARQWAQKNLASNWRNYDPEAVKQWLDTLPAAERKEVEGYLEK